MVKGQQTIEVQKSMSVKGDMDISHQSGTSFGIQSGTSLQVQAGTTGAITATAQLKCHGAMAEYSADAQTTVNGAIVMIN
jgi:hypothetical protein